MEERDDLKRKLLACALLHVPFEGWSTRLLEHAATEVDLDSSWGWRLFPRGPLEAIALWSYLLDQAMLKSLPPSQDMRVRERVALAIKTRLNLLTSHREAALKTTYYLARPSHLGEATHLLYQTINEIWYYAGDVSTDYNFYTKRALLAWVYSSTFIYWLRDTSDNHEKTWAFLDRRIDEVLKLPRFFPFPWKKRHG